MIHVADPPEPAPSNEVAPRVELAYVLIQIGFKLLLNICKLAKIITFNM
jgi:hypothetical protein